ncbi:MAG: hypothetical protein ACI88A_002495 [Paraglaciecola sp.]|jgi:hypothetical protein
MDDMEKALLNSLAITIPLLIFYKGYPIGRLRVFKSNTQI